MKPALIGVLVATIVLFVIGAVTILIALDKSPVQLLGVLTAIVAPTITSLFALAQVGTINTKIDAITAELDKGK
jgi:hypothetical protein